VCVLNIDVYSDVCRVFALVVSMPPLLVLMCLWKRGHVYFHSCIVHVHITSLR